MSRHHPERARIRRDLVESWKQSGQSVNVFCRDRQLTRLNFDHWRRILAAEPPEARSSPSSVFVPLRVVAEPMVEVVLRSGVVVRLPLSVAPEAVTRLLAAVGATSC